MRYLLSYNYQLKNGIVGFGSTDFTTSTGLMTPNLLEDAVDKIKKSFEEKNMPAESIGIICWNKFDDDDPRLSIKLHSDMAPDEVAERLYQMYSKNERKEMIEIMKDYIESEDDDE